MVARSSLADLYLAAPMSTLGSNARQVDFCEITDQQVLGTRAGL